MTSKLFYSHQEIRDLLGVADMRTVRKRLDRFKIPYAKDGRDLLVKRGSIEKCIDKILIPHE